MEGHSTHIALPQPHEIPKRDREDAMGAYLMMFAAWGAGLPLPLLNLLAISSHFLFVSTMPFRWSSSESIVPLLPLLDPPAKG